MRSEGSRNVYPRRFICTQTRSTNLTRTVVVFAIRPEEERRALEGCARGAELVHLRDVVREGRGVPVGLLCGGGVDVRAHGCSSATPLNGYECGRDEQRAELGRSSRVGDERAPMGGGGV